MMTELLLFNKLRNMFLLHNNPWSNSQSSATESAKRTCQNKGYVGARSTKFGVLQETGRAAEAYEKAGLYAEAGRIRKEHLENTQPVVQIGKVGDTILHDSVMISEDSEKLE